MKNAGVLISLVCLLTAVNFTSADTIRGINMDFVNIGNAGNAADTKVMSTDGTTGYGAVGYNYRIGKYEVTNAQWNAFKAAAGAPTGIPTYAYDQSTYFTGAQQPTNEVSWYEAAQFCNYLTSGNKYSGAYNFDQSGNFLGIDRVSSISNYGTTYVLPTEDEWYKAAFFKPDGSGYSLYAYGTDIAPIAGIQSNHNDVANSPWNVGIGTMEQNGTFDMMGNVWEWNETKVEPISDYLIRGVRGGSYTTGGHEYYLSSAWRNYQSAAFEHYSIGFRIAEIPEPATLLLLGLGGLVLKRKHS